MGSKNYFVYILSNYDGKVIYVGITNNLARRVFEHKNNLVKGFTQKYQVHYLVHYEIFSSSESAIEREKQIKSWNREKKNRLIRKHNPGLKDLYSKLLN